MLTAERMLTKHLRAIGLMVLLGLSACVAGDLDTSSVEQDVLTAPTGLTATATSSSRITLNWTAVVGATFYYIYESQAGGPFAAVSAVAAPSTTIKVAALAVGGAVSPAVLGFRVRRSSPTNDDGLGKR